ncbi:MAG: pseudouridine synthase [Mangrovibacterium sp.]
MREQNNSRKGSFNKGADGRQGSRDRKNDGERKGFGKSKEKGRNYRFDSEEEKPLVKKKPYEGNNFKKDYRKLVKRGVDTSKPVDTRLRLNRHISNAGICSRRDADKLIADGEITVNGKVITEMGYRVEPTDKVFHNGKRVIAEQKVYLLLNKPKGFVTSVDDPHNERTVMDLVKDACPERIYPVGRLDKATTGLLLFTNDGDLAKKLTHPSYEKKKIYHVFLKENFPIEYIEQIAKGIELEDGFVRADAISYVDPQDKSQIGIEIHSGRNRIVRRIFEHFGHRVSKLDRVYFAGLTKKNLPRGKYRFLTQQEVNFLKMS